MRNLLFTEKELRRFLKYVSFNGDCWTWTGYLAGKKNYEYGYFGFRIDSKGSCTRVHRLAHRNWIGEIPDGYEVDHLCRNRLCVNPDHLEAVPGKINRLRQTGCEDGTCQRGHDNWVTRKDGSRYCRTCQNNACHEYWIRKKEARNSV